MDQPFDMQAERALLLGWLLGGMGRRMGRAELDDLKVELWEGRATFTSPISGRRYVVTLVAVPVGLDDGPRGT
jgi:hypothetical protein